MDVEIGEISEMQRGTAIEALANESQSSDFGGDGVRGDSASQHHEQVTRGEGWKNDATGHSYDDATPNRHAGSGQGALTKLGVNEVAR
jgi:hypothetical protein